MRIFEKMTKNLLNHFHASKTTVMKIYSLKKCSSIITIRNTAKLLAPRECHILAIVTSLASFYVKKIQIHTTVILNIIFALFNKTSRVYIK